MVDNLVQLWHDIPDKTALVVLGAAIVSVLLQVIKHWLSLQSDKVITTMLFAFSFIASSLEYILGATNQNPTVLGQYTAVVVGVSSLLYRFGVKPGYNLLVDAKAHRAQQMASQKPVDEIIPSPDVNANLIDPTTSTNTEFMAQ